MKVAFLHTSTAHIATFDHLFACDNSFVLIHDVQEKWLADVVTSGLSDELRSQIAMRLTELEKAADVVICTCSSLGPVAQQLRKPNVFRVDDPMMKAAAMHAPVLLVMCLESTVASSTALLEQAFADKGINPDYRVLVCSDAWVHFERDDQELFSLAITAAVNKALSDDQEIGCVVLAQASMRVARKHLLGLEVPVFSSPELAAEKAMSFSCP